MGLLWTPLFSWWFILISTESSFWSDGWYCTVQAQRCAKKILQFFFISALWFTEFAVFEIVLEFNSSVLIFPGSIWAQMHVESSYEVKYEIELNHFKPLSCWWLGLCESLCSVPYHNTPYVCREPEILKTDAADSSKLLAPPYQLTHHLILEDHGLNIHSCVNLGSSC